MSYTQRKNARGLGFLRALSILSKFQNAALVGFSARVSLSIAAMEIRGWIMSKQEKARREEKARYALRLYGFRIVENSDAGAVVVYEETGRRFRFPSLYEAARGLCSYLIG